MTFPSSVETLPHAIKPKQTKAKNREKGRSELVLEVGGTDAISSVSPRLPPTTAPPLQPGTPSQYSI